MSQDLRLDAGGYLQIPDFVDPYLCRRWQETILENQNLWLKRLGSYSYGNGWYLDIETGLLHHYHAMAPAANELIQGTLPQFNDALTEFAQYLVGPNGETGLPARARRENLGPYWVDAGVHILGGPDVMNFDGGLPHADYEGLSPYVPMLFDPKTRAYSAILSIAKPAWGIGLDVWTHKRYTAGEAPSTEDKKIQPVSLDYEVGMITGIDSFLYHNLQKGAFSQENLWRMVGVIHFLYKAEPYPHWEHWF